MNKIVVLAVAVGMMVMVGCKGCSKSGSKPTGPKTFVKGVVVSSKFTSDDSQSILVDKNFDGIADEEFNRVISSTGDHAKILVGDTMTLVIQEGHVTNWYK